MAFDRSTQLFEENTCSATAEAPRSPFFRAWQCSQIKAMVQGPTCLANVGVGAFSTQDAVHYSFPVVCWYWVLGVHKVLPQSLERMEGNLDGLGEPRPYGWI